jgi:hypothetical protein
MQNIVNSKKKKKDEEEQTKKEREIMILNSFSNILL